MRKSCLTVIAFGISLNLLASSFGPLPSAQFSQSGSLSCTTKESCNLPSRRSLQKVTEDFINSSQSRLRSLDNIESEIRSGIQIYEHTTEEVFSRSGHGAEKSFLEKGKSLYEALPSITGLSLARQLVSSNSPFMIELRAMETLLKDADVKLINAKSLESKKKLKEDRKNNYLKFRKSGKFQSYKSIEQVKNLISHYEENGSVSPWLNQNKISLRTRFENCPLSIRRIVKKRKPSLKFDLVSTPFQYDIKNTPRMLSKLVRNGRLLTVKCLNKDQGTLNLTNNSDEGSVSIDYNISSTGVPILPKLK